MFLLKSAGGINKWILQNRNTRQLSPSELLRPPSRGERRPWTGKALLVDALRAGDRAPELQRASPVLSHIPRDSLSRRAVRRPQKTSPPFVNPEDEKIKPSAMMKELKEARKDLTESFRLLAEKKKRPAPRRVRDRNCVSVRLPSSPLPSFPFPPEEAEEGPPPLMAAEEATMSSAAMSKTQMAGFAQ